MQLKITEEIFQQFPHTVLGVVIAHDVNNANENAAVLALLRAAEMHAAQALTGVDIKTHPHIVPWREAYRAFGANPKDYPSSIENLLRRIQRGYTLPHINTLVDIYNTISLQHLLPVGGEDLDTLAGDVWLTVAGEQEAAIMLLGEKEARAPRTGEVIYKDDTGAICRRWNWKEAERTKLTERTRHAFLVIEGLPPVSRDLIARATQTLAALVKQHCGGAVTTARLDASTPSVALR
jgi:DNA/RNA-binding domain of Phe-tRNA-synthetase-like protein